MFKKLKNSLVMVNVVLLSIVLIMLFTSMNFTMIGILNKQSDATMNTIAKDEELVPPLNVPETKDFLSNSFFIKVNAKGETIKVSSIQNIKIEYAEDVKNLVYKKVNSTGTIKYNNNNLKFLIVFLDMSFLNEISRIMIIVSVIIGLVSLSLVFFISLYLANKAIVPIKSSWEKQNAFIADASHELRTPLAVINSNLEIIMDNTEETVESQGKWLGNIQGEIQRMTKQVEDLLFLARSDMNEEEMPMSPFNISKSIMQTVETFNPYIYNHGLELSYNIKPDVIVDGNEGRIKQLITILLDNAIKHTPKGGIIKIDLEDGDSVYKITVSDSGEGIHKEYLDKIFERFYRVDKSRSRAQGESGLGLAIAKCIVTEHNGDISVSSTLGKGTRFTMIFESVNNFV